MWQTLVKKAYQFLSQLQRLFPRPDPARPRPRRPLPSPPTDYAPLQRVLLADEVGRTLFEEYAQHRSQGRGEDETGWLLLGLREVNEAVVLATLPAGVEADTSMTHVWFNSTAQAVGSRIVRQYDRRLTLLGVVHTHPGSLRQPSDGDFRGDSQWVRNLRGHEGVFGIGTADAVPLAEGTPRSYQPRPHVHCFGELRFSWYALGQGDERYRPLPTEVIHGPDLARPLHPFWATLEEYAGSLERLDRQQRGIKFRILNDEWGSGLVVTVPLAEKGDSLSLLIRPKEVRYYLERQGQQLGLQPKEGPIDSAIYLLLADLARTPLPDERGSPRVEV